MEVKDSSKVIVHRKEDPPSTHMAFPEAKAECQTLKDDDTINQQGGSSGKYYTLLNV
jgi:hypothetical protein